jgi:hypothetical protein
MRKRRRVDKSIGEQAKRPSDSAPLRLLEARTFDRWWATLLVAAWLVLVIVVYFRLQLERVLKLVGALP